MSVILLCMGTRPEIIKLAPVYHALRELGHDVKVLHSGQHQELAWPLYRFFRMPPDLQFVPRREGQNLAVLNASLLEECAKAIESVKPDAVVVQGDTSTALNAGWAAYLANVPVAHVEAGLRTFERDPFPEEKNRELLGRLATWHFPPTTQSEHNLRQERVGGQVVLAGNTVVDAVQWAADHLTQYTPEPDDQETWQWLDQQAGRPVVLVTAHRRENWGQPMQQIVSAVEQLIQAHPDVSWLWPVHQNPLVKADVMPLLDRLPPEAASRLRLTAGLGYPVLVKALRQCRIVLTDSGGIQEEAATLGLPVVIMRESTERQELVDAGGGVLVGTDGGRILAHCGALLSDTSARDAMKLSTNPFGDGLSSQRIARTLDQALTPGQAD